MKYQESKLAHAYLDGLSGLEIGGSAHNPFGLNTRNVDYSNDMSTVFKKEEVDKCGEAMSVDIMAPGDVIPVPDNSEDFIINAHVIEHFYDPIKALKEWYRIIKPGGYIYIIAPHKERTFDNDRERTTLAELISRHESTEIPKIDTHEHYSVWITEDMVELVEYLGWKIVFVQDVDDKVSNGFAIVIQKRNPNDSEESAHNNVNFQLKQMLFQKTGIIVNDIATLEDAVYKVIQEIDSMKNSKFWKLRRMYLKRKSRLIDAKNKTYEFLGINKV